MTFAIGWDNLQVVTAFFNILFGLLAGGLMVYGYSLFNVKVTT